MHLVGLEKSLVVGHRSDGLQVWLLGERDLMDFSGAVASVYANHFDEGDVSVDEIENEDRKLLPDSIFLAITTAKRDVIATFRLTRWNDRIDVPLEESFGISIAELVSDLRVPDASVWHGGRLSINKNVLIREGFSKSYSLNILKSIVQYGFQILAGDPAAILLGEMDAMAIKAVSKIGVHCEKIGEALYYMGSQTIPIMIRLAKIQLLPYVESLQVRHTVEHSVGVEESRISVGS